MKYVLETMLGDLNSDELDVILPTDFDCNLSDRSLNNIEKTVLRKSGIKSRKINLKIIVPAAVCLVLAAGIEGFAIAADVREYNSAVEFFEENGLSADGLSRADIKAVYRDIITQRFVNGKTAEVLRNSVSGTEILQKEPSPEEMAAFWNGKIIDNSRYKYSVDYLNKTDEISGLEIIDKSVVECLRDGEPIWKISIPDVFVYLESCVKTADGTAVYGQDEKYEPDGRPVGTHAYLSRVDESGDLLWTRRLEHDFENEYIKSVVDNGDGTWAVISWGDFGSLCLSRFDMNGNEISCEKTPIGGKDVKKAVRLGEGYLVQLRGITDNVVKLDRDGNLIDGFVYESDECDFYITDMAEYKGRVYLSAYAVPKQKGGGGRNEIADILDYVFEKGNPISNDDLTSLNEELTSLLRENYTAVLLLCDPNVGNPETFYSVKGSLGGELKVEDDRLNWNVNNILNAGYSPYTSAFSIAGTCRVFCYSFDGSGAIVKSENTGKTVPYHR